MLPLISRPVARQDSAVAWLGACAALAALLFSAAVPAATLGQSTATLRVVVTSSDDGGPLQGANVVLRSPSGDAVVQAGATDEDGYHALTGLAPGRYRLEVSFVGYKTHRDTLTLKRGRRLYEVQLPIEKRRIEGITVQTRRGAARRSAGLETIKPAQIDRVPAPGGGGLASYLQTLPGVVSVGDRGGQIYIRGGAPTQNRTLVDGVPLVRPFHISSFFSALPQNTIQSVDLYASGFGAEYGEALSSVIDIQLRPGNMKRYGGSAAFGSHLASVLVEGPIEQGTESFLVSGRASTREHVSGPLLELDAATSFYDLIGRYTYQKDGTTCNATAIRTHDEGSLGPNTNRKLSWSNTAIGGRCLLLGTQYSRVFSISGGYSGFQNSVGSSGSPEQQASRWRAYLALNYDERILGNPVDFGARVTAGQYRARIDEQFTDLEQLREKQGMVRLHWALDWSIGDRLTVTPSFAARVTLNVRPSIDPRVRLSFQPDGTERQELSLSGGLYRQIDGGVTDQRDAGTVFTIWRPPAREDPIPSSLQGTIGYRYQFESRVEASVEGYAKQLRDVQVAEWTPEVGTPTETALADGIVYGADARVEFRQEDFYIYVGYGWSTVTYEAAADDLGAWVNERLFSYPPPHDRRHQLKALSTYQFLGLTASLSWQFGSGRPYTQVYGFDLSLALPDERPGEVAGTARTIYERPYGARLPTYHRLDASLKRSFKLSDQLGLNAELGVVNLYDRRNVFYYDIDRLERVDQSPFFPYLSIRVDVN